MHLAKMWNQDGHLLRHGTTCEKQTSQVRLESSAAAGSFIHSKNKSFSGNKPWTKIWKVKKNSITMKLKCR